VFNDFSTTSPRPIEFGNFCAVSGVAGAGATIAPTAEKSWGFLAIGLDCALPALLFVSKLRQPGDLSLPVSPDPRTALSLEGDFDKYFTLYCAAGFEEDALYVITPDLMALLIDQASPFDVEIAGNWMFFYSRIPFNMLDSSVYGRLFRILNTIGDKVIGKSQRGSGLPFAPSLSATTTPAAPVAVPVDAPVVVAQANPDESRHLASASEPATASFGFVPSKALGGRVALAFGVIVIVACVVLSALSSVHFG
jgi:hypothetical protein